MANASDILKSLDAAEIRQRLDAMQAEEKALKILLRAAARIEQQPISLSHRPRGEKGGDDGR